MLTLDEMVQKVRREAVLRVISDKFGGSQKRFSEAITMHDSTLSAMLSGKKPITEKTARKIEAALHLDDRSIDGGSQFTSINVLQTGENVPDSVEVKVVNLEFVPGTTELIDHMTEDGEPLDFRTSWLQKMGLKAENLLGVLVKGGDMAPSLHAGDTILLDTSDKDPQDGEVYVFNYEGEAVIKRLVRDGGRWWMTADNHDQIRYPRKVCENPNGSILGHVVHKRSSRI